MAKCRKTPGGSSFHPNWHPATVIKRNSDGTYHVDFTEDSDEDDALESKYIKLA